MADRYDERYRGSQYDRDRYQGREDRGFIERAGDEVRSWFGDDEASRRRERDEMSRGRDVERDYGRSRDYGRDYGPAWGDRPGSGREHGRGGESGTGSWGVEQGWRGEGSRDYRTGGGFERSGSERSGFGAPDIGSRGYRSEYGDEFRREPYGTRAGSGYFSSYGSGNFAGRGPKGYQRSDERIREDVCDRLADDPNIDATDIEVTVNRGEVMLGGTVRERDDKRRAEDLVERISGVREVHNSLRVHRGELSSTGEVFGDTSSGTTGTTSTSSSTGKTTSNR